MSNIVMERNGSICQIEFNRPDKKNAITNALFDDLTAAKEALSASPEKRQPNFTKFA